MAIYRIRILTSWLAAPGRNDMRVAVEHPATGVTYSDVTGQADANIPTDPNALIVEAYPVDDALLEELEADANALVMWSEEIQQPDIVARNAFSLEELPDAIKTTAETFSKITAGDLPLDAALNTPELSQPQAADKPTKASKNPKEKPTKAEKQALKTLIRNRFGLTAAQINALLDENDGALDAEKIETALRNWLRGRPKAKG